MGAHAAVPVGDGLEMRPRFDYTRLDGGSFSANSLDSTLTLEGLGLGADILAYGDRDLTSRRGSGRGSQTRYPPISSSITDDSVLGSEPWEP